MNNLKLNKINYLIQKQILLQEIKNKIIKAVIQTITLKFNYKYKKKMKTMLQG